MTVINKLSQTLEMLKSCESNCNTFALDTNDQNAKQMYQKLAKDLKMCTQMLENRVTYVANQEPQYKQELEGTQNMQSSQGTQSAVQSSQSSQNQGPDQNIPEL